MEEIIFRAVDVTIPEKGKRLVPLQELVRCLDCKHFRYYGLSVETVSECTINHCENPPEDFFCADGERNEE